MPNQYTKHPLTIEERLFSKIEKTENCWLWNGTLLNGHGVLYVNHKTKYAERLMYVLQSGRTIPKGKIVRHTCGDARCLNPDHMALWTLGELRASTAKYRSNVEERLPLAKAPASTEERILAKVRKTKTCWLWTGSVVNGHGIMRMNERTKYVERLIYELRKGKIPNGKLVLHSCGNTICLNPSHLYIGTPSERNLGNVERRRSAKLDFETAERIREAHSKHNVTMEELAKRYHVSRGTVRRTIRKIIWKKATR